MIEKPICICYTKQELRNKLLEDIKNIPSFVHSVGQHEDITYEKLADEIIEMAFLSADQWDVDDGRESMIYAQANINGYLRCVIEQDIVRNALIQSAMMESDINKPPNGREC